MEQRRLFCAIYRRGPRSYSSSKMVDQLLMAAEAMIRCSIILFYGNAMYCSLSSYYRGVAVFTTVVAVDRDLPCFELSATNNLAVESCEVEFRRDET